MCCRTVKCWYHFLEAVTHMARWSERIPGHLGGSELEPEVFAMLSDHPDRFLVSVAVAAALPMDFETWCEFGRSINEPCSGSNSGGIVSGGHHTLTFVLPPETQQPGSVAIALIVRAAANYPWTRFGIDVVGEPFVERMSDTTFART
jgi:hypothetical protein